MLQIYTGGGKGKTTAAIGLAVRMLGAGRRVYIMQFMKSLAYSEQKVLQGFAPQLVLKTTGKPFFIAAEGMLSEEEKKAWGEDVVIFPPGEPPSDYVDMVEAGLKEARETVAREKFGLVILDELNVSLFFGLARRESVESFIDSLPADTELVITGRNAPDWLVERADLVTEMKEIKHYYTKGVAARRGVEN